MVFAGGIALSPPLLAQAQLISGNDQEGVPGTVLARPLSVRLVSGASPVGNLPLVFRITADSTGGATISTESTSTNPFGFASTVLTPGPSPGSVRVCADAFIAPEVCFDASADWPELEIVAGNGQSVPPFSAFAPLVVGLDDDEP